MVIVQRQCLGNLSLLTEFFRRFLVLIVGALGPVYAVDSTSMSAGTQLPFGHGPEARILASEAAWRQQREVWLRRYKEYALLLEL